MTMKLIHTTLTLAAWTFVAGCTSYPHYVGYGRQDAPATPAIDAADPAGNAWLEANAESEQPPVPPSQVELDLWSSPEFQRQVALGLIAETEIEPTTTDAEKLILQQASELLGAGRADRARALIERNLDGNASAALVFHRAYYDFQDERLETAQAGFRRAVDLALNFRRAWRMLGLTAVRREQYDSAIDAFTEVVRLGGSDSLTYGLLGFAHLREGSPLAAESAYRMAVLLDPETLDHKLGLAQAFFRQRRFAEAATLCDALIEERPDKADLWLLQANAFIGMEETLRAAQNFEMVDRLGGATAAMLLNLADVYVNQELFEPGVRAHLRALRMDPPAAPDRALRATRVLIARQALDDAKELLAGIESVAADVLVEEQRKELLRLRARIAVAEGATDEQADALRAIVALDPLDGQALNLLGQHEANAGDFERAAFYYERAEGLPEFEAEAKVGLAKLLVKQKRYDEAVSLLRRAQDIERRSDVQAYLEKVQEFAKTR